MIDIDKAVLEQTILNNKDLDVFLVDFWAPWCGPCKALMPELQKISDSGIPVFKFNVDNDLDYVKSMGVRAVPTVLVYQGSNLKETVVAANKQKILAALENLKSS